MRHKENHPDTIKALDLIQNLKHKGLLQKDIARYLKISEFTMINWLKGKGSGSAGKYFNTLQILCKEVELGTYIPPLPLKIKNNIIEKALNIIRSHADNGMTHENVRKTIEEIKNLK